VGLRGALEESGIWDLSPVHDPSERQQATVAVLRLWEPFFSPPYGEGRRDSMGVSSMTCLWAQGIPKTDWVLWYELLSANTFTVFPVCPPTDYIFPGKQSFLLPVGLHLESFFHLRPLSS
jgi:hypothetical protein